MTYEWLSRYSHARFIRHSGRAVVVNLRSILIFKELLALLAFMAIFRFGGRSNAGYSRILPRLIHGGVISS